MNESAVGFGCLLLFGPKPSGDSLADIGESLRFALALAHATWQFRALGNDPAVLFGGENNSKTHTGLLSSLIDFAPISLSASVCIQWLNFK